MSREIIPAGHEAEEPAIRVVSSPVVRRAFQIREAEQRGASVGLSVMTPGDLARRLLASIPSAPRIASPTQELRILWLLTQETLETLKDGTFSVSRLTVPSFVSRLLATLRQLKQANLHGMSLDRVSRALDSSHLRRRWEFLASLYSRYDEALADSNLVGEVGVFHFVAQQVNPTIAESLGARIVLLHYLVDVTPAQAALFSALRDKGLEVRMVLPDIPAVHDRAFAARLESLFERMESQIVTGVPHVPAPREVVAPTPAEEARWLARFAREILRSGAPPHSVLILFRRPILPLPVWHQHFADFSVPLAGVDSENARVFASRLILTLADLAVNDFPRRSMALFVSAFCQARRIPQCRFHQIFALPGEEGDEELLAPVIWRGYERWRHRLPSIPEANDMLSLMDKIRGVHGKPPAEFVSMCREICREVLPDEQGVNEVLDEASDSLILLLQMAQDAGASESETLEVLRRLEWAPLAEGSVEPGRVGWGAFPEMVGISADHVLVAGVTDSQIPAPPPTPFVLSQSECLAVNGILGSEIFLTPESYLLRERLFFENSIAAARESVLVSRHELSGTTPQYESPLWRLLKATRYAGQCAVKTYTFRRSLLPEPADVESLDDALRATAAYPHPSSPSLLKEKQADLDGAVNADIERLQQTNLVLGFDGVLPRESSPEFLRNYGASEEVAASPTRLASYGKCPFIFFAQTVLRLADLPEEDAPPTLTLGSLVHEVLDHSIRPLIRHEATWKEFPSLVAEQAEETFARVRSETFAGNLEALKRALIRFAQHEMTVMLNCAREDGSRKIKGPVHIQPLDAERAVSGWLTSGSGGLYIQGRTDRVDRVQGDPALHTNWLLTDYKIGGRPEPARLRKSLQLPLYAHLLVLQKQGLTLDQIGYRYVSVTRRETGPALSTALKLGASAQKCAQALAAAEGIIDRIRAGYFTPFPSFGDLFPNKPAVPQRLRKLDVPCGYCAYLPVCRISLLDGVRKDLSPFGFTPAEGAAASTGNPAETPEENE